MEDESLPMSSLVLSGNAYLEAQAQAGTMSWFCQLHFPVYRFLTQAVLVCLRRSLGLPAEEEPGRLSTSLISDLSSLTQI